MDQKVLIPNLVDLKTQFDNELDSVIKFWLKHSHDSNNGLGFYNCLDENGSPYDETKYGWLQGRQVWTYCKLYNRTQKYHTTEILDAAIEGGEFLLKHVKRAEDNRCYFMTTCDGEPIKIQRTVFSECFYVMAMSGLYQVTKEQKYKGEALSVLTSLLHWIHVDDSALGRPKLSGSLPLNTMSVPMMVLCILYEVCEDDEQLKIKYLEEENWAVEEIVKHIQRNGTVVLENISLDGKEIPGCQGRLINLGHAIEAGWFLLRHAIHRDNNVLKQIAVEKFLNLPFELGWDSKDGGLLYFLDADGFSPTQLEWNMKLWWPHCEALIGFLMAFKETKNIKHFETFKKVFEYTWAHFPDKTHGGWYGYCSREGEITHRFKGGPFKGCFHTLRALFMCSGILGDLINELKP